MTTATRPTWTPAKGGNEQGGTRIFGSSQKYSSRDLAAHTTLKPRKHGQDTQDEVRKRDIGVELEEGERKHFGSKDKSFSGLKQDALDHVVHKNLDVDDDSDVGVKSDESDDDDDDDEDDIEALLAELEQIKRERAEEMARKKRQQQKEELKTKEAELMRGNPLLDFNNPINFNVKRRWVDDVVFKNQARGETKPAKRFINDTIRSDFHRNFLQKSMK